MVHRLLPALLAVSAIAVAPAAAGATGPLPSAGIVAKLNAERARLGMAPAAHDPTWSAKCALHNRWMKLNHLVQHPEVPGTRGASADGNWAGTSSVLSGGWNWRHANPWLNAPIHLSQVYHPLLRVTGASDRHRHSCLTTWPGVRHEAAYVPSATPQTDHVFTWPTDGGTAVHAQRASESPYTPQEKVGLRSTRTTGPYLYVWSYTDLYDESAALPEWDPVAEELKNPAWFDAALAPLQRLVSGQLLGPGGKTVPTKLIDDATVDGYVGQGNGWLLPTRRLKPRTTYRATVVLATGAETAPEKQRQIIHTWTFRTTRETLGYVATPRRRRV
jgi:hypothetical protein